VRITLGLDDDDGLFTESDARGRFELTGVPPGEHTLRATLRGRRKGVTETVVVVDGETTSAALDLSRDPGCTLRVTARVAGATLAGLDVKVFDPTAGWSDGNIRSLAPDGTIVLQPEIDGPVELLFRSPVGAFLGRAAGIRSIPGHAVEAEVDLPAGSLVLELPPGFELPAAGHGSITLDDPSRPKLARLHERSHVAFTCSPAGAVVQMSSIVLAGPAWNLGPVAPGDYGVVLQVRSGGATTALEGTAAIHAGERTTCELSEKR
jgi:hypothetical protein